MELAAFSPRFGAVLARSPVGGTVDITHERYIETAIIWRKTADYANRAEGRYRFLEKSVDTLR
jgi:hypothetical protein